MARTRDGSWGLASAGQLAHALDDQIVLAWNDAAAVEQAFDDHAADIAAIVTEPMMINAGTIEPRAGYVALLRRLCDQHGAVLIFDEVITGFRLALGGGAERFGVTPDLTTYGNAMAAGWPVSALAGKADLMKELSTRRVNHSGTFNGGVMAPAATHATITWLRENLPYRHVADIGGRLMSG